MAAPADTLLAVALLGREGELSQCMEFWDHETEIYSQPHYTLIS